MEAFKEIEIRNCRRFYKHCYTLALPIDNSLIDKLSLFGLVEINKLSEYSSQFKDTFKICFDEQIEISGTICDQQLYLTVNKRFGKLKNKLEDSLRDWFQSKHQ